MPSPISYNSCSAHNDIQRFLHLPLASDLQLKHSFSVSAECAALLISEFISVMIIEVVTVDTWQ